MTCSITLMTQKNDTKSKPEYKSVEHKDKA